MKLNIGNAENRWTKKRVSMINTETSPGSKKSSMVEGLVALRPFLYWMIKYHYSQSTKGTYQAVDDGCKCVCNPQIPCIILLYLVTASKRADSIMNHECQRKLSSWLANVGREQSNFWSIILELLWTDISAEDVEHEYPVTEDGQYTDFG